MCWSVVDGGEAFCARVDFSLGGNLRTEKGRGREDTCVTFLARVGRFWCSSVSVGGTCEGMGKGKATHSPWIS